MPFLNTGFYQITNHAPVLTWGQQQEQSGPKQRLLGFSLHVGPFGLLVV